MKLRPIQLVCLALLLATLRLADPAAPQDLALRTGVFEALLGRTFAEPGWQAAERVVRPRTAAPASRPSRQVATALPESAAARTRAPWAMPVAAEASAAIVAHTGLGRA